MISRVRPRTIGDVTRRIDDLLVYDLIRRGPVTARADGSYTIRLRVRGENIGRISGKPDELLAMLAVLRYGLK